MTCEAATVSYATLDDLSESGLAQEALASLPLTTRQKILLRASRYADTFLRDRYTLPMLCPFDQSLIHAVVQIADYWLMTRRGVRSGQDLEIFRLNFLDATDFLKRIANGQAQLCVTQSAPESSEPMLGTNESRNYSPPSLGTDAPVFGTGGFGI